MKLYKRTDTIWFNGDYLIRKENGQWQGYYQGVLMAGTTFRSRERTKHYVSLYWHEMSATKRVILLKSKDQRG